MKQRSLSSQSVFEKYGRKRRRELYLDEMEQVVRWAELVALVEPHYAKTGKGRKPVGLSIMLRTYFVQQWFNLFDPGAEELMYELEVVCFRHLLEKHSLGGEMLETVKEHQESKGIRIQTGTIVDASIIHAPSSTKNEAGHRIANAWPRSRSSASADQQTSLKTALRTVRP
jgi:transposase, IS5 family